MKEDRALEILKKAILLERRGWSLYRSVGKQTRSESVREICDFLAGEEEKHIAYLSRQFSGYRKNGEFSEETPDSMAEAFADSAVTDSIRKEIDAAGYEAAALSAALELEKNAIALYSDRAAAATDTAESALYRKLADWEREHLDLLAKINRELTEDVWYDNQFWPF